MKSSYKITKEIPIDKINLAIMEKIEKNVGKLSVVLDSSESCFDLTYLKNDYGNNFRSVVDISNSKRVTVYYGIFFDSNKKSCDDEKKKKFKVGAYIEEKIILDKNIEELVNSYNLDYSKLKRDLGIEDFTFEFKDKDNIKIQKFSVEGKIPENAEVKSKTFPVRVINSKAEISELTLNIKAWK